MNDSMPSLTPPVTPQEHKRTILIVDDDQLLLGTYAAVFRQEGFRVDVAANGEEALEILKGPALPDIVLTGIIMPKLGGFELVEKMRADPRLRRIPVAISSHRGLPEDKARAEALGVSDFLIQGFTTPRDVLRRVEVILGINRAFKIAVIQNRFSAANLLALLNKHREVPCVPAEGEEIVLELEATPEEGKFRVHIVC